MGALIFGQPLNETIIFNHEKLYEPFHETVVQNNELTPILPEVRRQMKNGRFRDAAALFFPKNPVIRFFSRMLTTLHLG